MGRRPDVAPNHIQEIRQAEFCNLCLPAGGYSLLAAASEATRDLELSARPAGQAERLLRLTTLTGSFAG